MTMTMLSWAHSRRLGGLHLRPHSGSKDQLLSLVWQLNETTSSSTKGCVSVSEAEGKPAFESRDGAPMAKYCALYSTFRHPSVLDSLT
jgi:hypothetical protein